MKELETYIGIMEWLFQHDAEEDRDERCYKTFCNEVNDKKELEKFIENYKII